MFALMGIFGLLLFLALPVSLAFEVRDWWLRSRRRTTVVASWPHHSLQLATPPTYTTLRGDVVKSKAEATIANYLSHEGIRYEYESMVKTTVYKRNRPISRPDFYLPNYNLYLEYWGMVDHQDPQTRMRYVKNMNWKMAQYHRNGIKFISIYPKNMENLDWVFRTKFRETMGFELPKLLGNGQGTARYCSSCGTAVIPLARFCTKCGRTIQ